MENLSMSKKTLGGQCIIVLQMYAYICQCVAHIVNGILLQKTSFFPKALVDDLSAAQNYLADEIFRNFISDSNLRCKNVGQ